MSDGLMHTGNFGIGGRFLSVAGVSRQACAECSKTAVAYAPDDFLEKRRSVVQAWNNILQSRVADGLTVDMSRRIETPASLAYGLAPIAKWILRTTGMWLKGERFFESPLSAEAKRFLLTFSSSSEERVLSDRHLSKDQSELRGAIDDRAKADTINRLQSKLQSHWADPLGVQVAEVGRFRWWDVARFRRTDERGREVDCPERPPAWDHGSIWVREGKPIIAVSQLYPWLLNKDVEKLDAFAERYTLKFYVSNYPAWHYPGQCWLIEWRSSTG